MKAMETESFVEMSFPLKEGLRHQLLFENDIETNVEMSFPLKEGLRLTHLMNF